MRGLPYVTAGPASPTLPAASYPHLLTKLKQQKNIYAFKELATEKRNMYIKNSEYIYQIYEFTLSGRHFYRIMNLHI